MPQPPRRIAVVTSSRADYGHLVWPLRELLAHSDVTVELIVTGAHLSPEFGMTVDAIEADGFHVDERIECLLSSDSDIGMAKTIGLATASFADCLGRRRPDLLLLIADRYEMIAPACAALALRLPMAHIEGGEVSEGAIDNAVRNALTMMCHVHFVPTRLAARRVVMMGEEPWRIHRVGAPSLDHLRRCELLPTAELESRLEMSLADPPIVVAYHPVTLERDPSAEADAVYSALDGMDDRPVVFCFPNADAGSRSLIERARAWCAANTNATLHVNLEHLVYWSLLAHARIMVGNSSSGIMEAPSLELPSVNIGRRQQGRERARSVIDVDPDVGAILAAVARAESEAFRTGLIGMENPYGDGHAGERIAAVLSEVTLGPELLWKRAQPVPDGIVAPE